MRAAEQRTLKDMCMDMCIGMRPDMRTAKQRPSKDICMGMGMDMWGVCI